MENKIARVVEIKKLLEERNALYEEFDRLVIELAQEGFLKTEVNNLVVQLKDNFAQGKNTGWTSAAIRRYDIEVITKELAEKRERKVK